MSFTSRPLLLSSDRLMKRGLPGGGAAAAAATATAPARAQPRALCKQGHATHERATHRGGRPALHGAAHGAVLAAARLVEHREVVQRPQVGGLARQRQRQRHVLRVVELLVVPVWRARQRRSAGRVRRRVPARTRVRGRAGGRARAHLGRTARSIRGRPPGTSRSPPTRPRRGPAGGCSPSP
eukprot:scaffold1915_cov288-Prasinococcus_capsulatus_cf.AAC.6